MHLVLELEFINLKRQDKCTLQNHFLSYKSCRVISVKFLIHALCNTGIEGSKAIYTFNVVAQ